MTLWRIILSALVLAFVSVATAQELIPAIPPPGSPPEAFSGIGAPAPAVSPAPALTPPLYTPPSYSSPAYTPPAAKQAWTPNITQQSMLSEQLVESTWYTRVDYFHWKERLDGQDFVNEEGALFTLGYMRRNGAERFRGEFFGADVNYNGGAQWGDGSSEPLNSHTKYTGVRGEYDLIYDPEWWPNISLLIGVGSRFWFRDLPTDMTVSGNWVQGYEETWWTVYPYLGLERRRTLNDDIEFYFSGRIGATAYTYQHVSLDDVTLYPKLGLTGQVELGLRGRHLFLSTYFDGMAWRESALVHSISGGWIVDSLQPQSRMLTVGLRSGFNF